MAKQHSFELHIFCNVREGIFVYTSIFFISQIKTGMHGQM